MTKRQNRATVADEDLKGSFAQGVNEGMRTVGYAMIIFMVGQKFVQKMPIVAISDVPEMVNNFLSSMTADDYAQGVEIKIVQDETTEATPEQLAVEDGVEDAEVVED